MHHRLALATVVTTIVTTLLSACGILPDGSVDDGSEDVFPAMGRTQRVTESGGEFVTEGLRVTVPATAIGGGDRATISLGTSGGEFDAGFGRERIGKPVRLDHDAPLNADTTVVWDLPDLTPEELAGLRLVRWNEDLEVWSTTDQPFSLANGQLTADIRQFSAWTWITSTAATLTQRAGEVTGTRAGELDCTTPHGESPTTWVRGVVLPDSNQPAVPLRTCLDPDKDERITMRAASNRRFSQRLAVTRGEPFAWIWHGEQDYTPAGIVTGLAAEQLSNERGVVLKATHPQAVGIARPDTPGMHSFELESRIDASTVAVDVLALIMDQIGGDVRAFESPVVNVAVQAMFDCGGERLLQSRQFEATTLAKDAVTVMKSCLEDDFVADVIERAKLTEIAKGGAAGRRAEQAFRWSHHLGAKLGFALRTWDASHFAAEFTSTLALGPTTVSMQLVGRPQSLGAWTATCTDATADTDALFRNLFWQEEFQDMSRELHEFPGFPAAADRAIGPLANCGRDHQEAVAGEVESTWADPAAGRIVADALRKRFELTGCSLSPAAVRAIADDPNAIVERLQCTNDKQWLMITGQFKDGSNSTPASSLVLRRDQNRWRVIARMSHGGDCVVLVEAGAPIREIDRMPGAFPCAPIVAGHLLEREVITTSGIGELRIGMSIQQALAAGYLERSNPGSCGPYQSAFSLSDRQLLVSTDSGRVNGLLFKDRRWRTKAGARVGDSEQRVRGLYPDLTPGIDPPSGLTTLSVVASNRDRVTFVLWEGSRVGAISVESGNRPPGWSGC